MCKFNQRNLWSKDSAAFDVWYKFTNAIYLCHLCKFYVFANSIGNRSFLWWWMSLTAKNKKKTLYYRPSWCLSDSCSGLPWSFPGFDHRPPPCRFFCICFVVIVVVFKKFMFSFEFPVSFHKTKDYRHALTRATEKDFSWVVIDSASTLTKYTHCS